MYKHINKGKNQKKIPLHYFKCIHQLWFRNLNLKVDHRTVGEW